MIWDYRPATCSLRLPTGFENRIYLSSLIFPGFHLERNADLLFDGIYTYILWLGVFLNGNSKYYNTWLLFFLKKYSSKMKSLYNIILTTNFIIFFQKISEKIKGKSNTLYSNVHFIWTQKWENGIKIL